MDEGKNLGWAIIGKASVVVGLLVAIFALKDSVFPSGPDVVADCASTELQVAPRTLAALIDSVAPSRVKAGLGDAAKSISDSDLRRASGELQHAVLDASLLGQNMMGRVVYITCEIVNAGSKDAADVKLTLPQNVVLATVDGRDVDLVDSKTVPLGTMRPGARVEVGAWSQSLFVFFSDNASLNFENGIGQVREARLVYSPIFQLISQPQGFAMALVSLLTAGFLAFSVFRLWKAIQAARQRNKSTKDSEPA